MRFKLIACKALYREISLLSATCPNFIDVTYLRQGFHDTPRTLARILQEEIDKVEAFEDPHTYKSNVHVDKPFDAILLGYGLCSNGVVSLHSKKYPIVIPKVHDCISMLLGSREDYDREFRSEPGTFWYTPSWIENAAVPCRESEEAILAYYEKEYGEDGEYIYQAQMLNNYTRCAYIKWERIPMPEYEAFTREAAEYLKIPFASVTGRETLLTDFLNGNWDDRFLVVEPGYEIAADLVNNRILEIRQRNES